MKRTKIFGLGGFQEIGKSTLLVEHENTILLIDSGVKFADASTTGLQGMIPNFQYLKDNQEKVKALLITHGHEDHIGGVIYLIQQVRIPVIIAPKIAIEYLKYKIKDQGLKIKIKFIEITHDGQYQFGAIEVDFWGTQHSIPHAFGIRLKTPNGTLMATGDFRFDYRPIGDFTDFDKLKIIGQEGLTILLSDSTNAMRPEHSPSESDILKDIEKLIVEAKRKVIITGFASNLSRMKALIELGIKHDKKIAIFGRSMVNNITIARKIKLINDDTNAIIDRKKIAQFEENELMVLTTGSQGEEMAALNRMSIGKHAQVKIQHGDVIIFSSSPIPGNRQKIELLVNRLYKLGALIKENGHDGYLHTSGHAYHDEHVKLFSAVKPKFFIPYHGDYRMCLAHGKTAIECGVKAQNIIYAAPGQVIYMENEMVTLSDETIDVRPIYIDGTKILDVDDKLVYQRYNLGQNGFISVVLPIDKKKNYIIGRPKIISKGSFLMKTANEVMEQASKLTHGAVLYLIKNNENWTVNDVKKVIIDRLQIYFYKVKRRRPIIVPTILFTDSENDATLSSYRDYFKKNKPTKKAFQLKRSEPKRGALRNAKVVEKSASSMRSKTTSKSPLNSKSKSRLSAKKSSSLSKKGPSKEEILSNLRKNVFDLDD